MPRRRINSDEEQIRKADRRPSTKRGKVVDWPKVAEVPDPPKWLTEPEGLNMWEEMAPQLFGQKVMTVADIKSFAHLCQMHGRVARLYTENDFPGSSLLAQLRQYLMEFGMTPASRLRVLKDDPRDSGNRFGNNGPKARDS